MTVSVTVEPRGASFALVIEGLSYHAAEAMAASVLRGARRDVCVCGTPFKRKRQDHRHCSSRCRWRASKRKTRDAQYDWKKRKGPTYDPPNLLALLERLW